MVISHRCTILRVVCALASKTARVRTRPVPERRSLRQVTYDSCTTYDIWFAGVTQETYGVIQDDVDAGAAQALLQSMRHACDAARMYKDEASKRVARQMQPAVSTEEDHWSLWAEL